MLMPTLNLSPFFNGVYAETNIHSFSAEALYMVCRDLGGLPMQTHQDRLIKKELLSGFPSLPRSGNVLWQHSSAGWHCAPLRHWRQKLLSLDCPSPGEYSSVCSTSSGPLPHLCHSVVTAPTKHPCCLSFIYKLSFLLISSLKKMCSRANSCCAIFDSECQ